MEQRIRRYIEEKGLIVPGDRVLAGVSGGADSVCLLLVLAGLRESFPFRLEAVHVEHGIRGEESLADARFVAGLCDAEGIPLRIRRVDVPSYAREHHLGDEEAARLLRYEALLEEARMDNPNDETQTRIALAHHMEDNAETVLLHLLRGSGIRGLQGIAPIRLWRGIPLVRPLLAVRRGEIEAYLLERGQVYRTDSTNADTRYARNRLRCLVFPEMERINHQAVAHINETAERIGRVYDYLCLQVEEQEKEIAGEDNGRRTLDIPGLWKLHPAIREQIVRNAICSTAGQEKDISAIHISQVLNLSEGSSGRRIRLPYSVFVSREFDKLVFFQTKERTIRPEDTEQKAVSGRPDIWSGQEENGTEMASDPAGAAGRRAAIGRDQEENGTEMASDPAGAAGRRAAIGRDQEENETEMVSDPAGTIVLEKEWLEQLRMRGGREVLLLPGGDRLSVEIASAEGFFQKTLKKAYTKCFDYDKINGRLEIRHRRPGDYFTIKGGHHKKLKNALIEDRIPAGRRGELWLVAEGSRILWLVGGRRGEEYKISEDSVFMLVLSYLPAPVL